MWSKDLAKPAAHALPHAAAVGLAASHHLAAREASHPVQHEAHASGEGRRLDDVDEATHARGDAAAHGHAEHLLGELGHAVELRRASGDDGARADLLFEA